MYSLQGDFIEIVKYGKLSLFCPCYSFFIWSYIIASALDFVIAVPQSSRYTVAGIQSRTSFSLTAMLDSDKHEKII